ncbi:MAG: NADH-quinone oxidoreductase subunit J, partial [Ectothiorhodospiraceae bacterium]|nr:NADH-quinone oxidoreductase subunit J [Ectothiorhodospiraceae bacterium]
LGIGRVRVSGGAVMVLVLFVGMMLELNLGSLREGFMKHFYIGVPIAVVMAVQMLLVVGSGLFAPETLPQAAMPIPEGTGNTSMLGGVLYTVYVYPFELAAVILLVAIIAAIMLTLRRREGTKHQNPGEQVKVRKADRLRLVNLPSSRRASEQEQD